MTVMTRNTGKSSEAAVRAALHSIDVDTFDWQRMYDATSARGAFMAQVGDFQFFLPGVHGVIEVKSTAHEYRLTKGAFSDGQRAKLTKRAAAGGHVWVIVHHHTVDQWRVLKYEDVRREFDDLGRASLDLRQTPTYPSAVECVSIILMESLENGK